MVNSGTIVTPLDAHLGAAGLDWGRCRRAADDTHAARSGKERDGLPCTCDVFRAQRLDP